MKLTEKLNSQVNEANDKIFAETGKAVTILAKLDIKLSNMFTGDKERDAAVKSLRSNIKSAMDSIASHKILSDSKKLK